MSLSWYTAKRTRVKKICDWLMYQSEFEVATVARIITDCLYRVRASCYGRRSFWEGRHFHPCTTSAAFPRGIADGSLPAIAGNFEPANSAYRSWSSRAAACTRRNQSLYALPHLNRTTSVPHWGWDDSGSNARYEGEKGSRFTANSAVSNGCIDSSSFLGDAPARARLTVRSVGNRAIPRPPRAWGTC